MKHGISTHLAGKRALSTNEQRGRLEPEAHLQQNVLKLDIA